MTAGEDWSDRVSLASFAVEHISPAYLAWLNDPDVMGFTEARFAEHTPESAEAYIRASAGDPNCRLWRIMVDGDRHVGNIRLSAIQWRHGRADVAIILGEKDVWGRGVASAAIGAAAAVAFAELGLHKLTAGMYGPNRGSIRAFEKAGFTIEARRPEHYRHDGRFVEGVFMGLLARDVAGMDA